MNDLEDRITASLRANAERSGPFEGLERQAVPRATAIRRHRRIAGVAMVAALVAVIPLGVEVVPESLLNGIQPAGRTTSDADRTVELPDDLGTLPRGMAPMYPWYDGEYIHDGLSSTRVRVGKDNALQFGRIREGFWIQRGGAQSPITLIDGDGGTIGSLAANGTTTSPVVSADWQRLAWTEDGGWAVLADAKGRELKRQRIRPGVEPIGFVGNKVLLEGAEIKAVLWDPSTESVENLGLDVPMDRNATDGRDLVPIRTGDCAGVYSFTQRKTLWKRCDFEVTNGLSDNGRYTVLDGAGALTGTVTEAETGHPILRIENLTASPIEWKNEPGDTMLIESEWDGRKAIVRCKVTSGRCELATEPVAVSAGDDYATGSPPPTLAANN